MASKTKELLDNMMECCCDKYCKHPQQADSQEELEAICEKCKLNEFYDKLLEHGVGIELITKPKEKHEKGYNPWQE